MQLLILGGTRFMGSFVTELALERGHDVTLVHRGQSAIADFEGATHEITDRADGHRELAGGSWDVVIDTSGFLPAIVADAVHHLHEGCDHYVYISSVSAYADLSQTGLDEDSELSELPQEIAESVCTDTSTPVDMNHYGPMKAACEFFVDETFEEDHTTIVRPGLIVGPRDYTDRFNYWVRRLADGGDVLAPAPPSAPVQVIDARDLARFVLDLAEQRQAGVFNAGALPTSFENFLQTGIDAFGSDACIAWCDPTFLASEGIEEWSDLPLWIREGSGFEAMNDFDVSRALDAGLEPRPLRETFLDTLEWLQQASTSQLPDASALHKRRERDVLDHWRAHAG